jgi:RNA polymerase sigma-70 factor (ECF subfamily)
VGDPSERALCEALRRGDRSAFDRVYARYGERLHRFLFRLARRRDLADDLYQETWMALARSASTLREDTDLAAWLFTVARNEYRSHQRWAILDVSRLVALPDGDLVSAEPGPELATEASAAAARLERALADLPTVHREVLLLVAIEGLSQEQVAEILHTSYEAVRQRLSRARAALASRLAALEKPVSSALVRTRSPS